MQTTPAKPASGYGTHWNDPPAAPNPAPVVTTQQTAKKYKGRMLIGGLLCGVGVICLVAEKPVAAVLFFAVGLGIYFSARMGAWWHNG